jgi:AraC-like DNA-binding protein
MAIQVSTRDVHPRDRASFWREVATRAFFRHTFCSSVGNSFLGTLCGGSIGALQVTRCSCDPCVVGRDARDYARDSVDDLFLTLRLAGRSVASQDARQASQDPGTITLLDARRAGEISYLTPTASVFVNIPRVALVARLGNVAALTARPIQGDGPVAGLAVGFLSMLAERMDALDKAAGAKLADQALDLIALAFTTETGQSGVTLSSPRATALLRLRSAIESRLCEPGLKPAAAAAAAGISVRYANALLSQEGFSVERYILHRRLERCRRALEDPMQAQRMVSEIAFGWGFSDVSHFARRFKAEYGCTPGDWRRRAAELASAARSHEDAWRAAGGWPAMDSLAAPPAAS